MIVQGLIGIRPLVLGHIHPGSTAQVLRTEILMLVLNCLLIMDPVSNLCYNYALYDCNLFFGYSLLTNFIDLF